MHSIVRMTAVKVPNKSNTRAKGLAKQKRQKQSLLHETYWMYWRNGANLTMKKNCKQGEVEPEPEVVEVNIPSDQEQ